MKNKKSKARISIKKFIINNFPKNEIKSNINLFLNAKYTNRNNNNNLVSSDNQIKKKNIVSKFRNDIKGKEKLISLTENIYRSPSKLKIDEIKNMELSQKNNQTLKNKSSDDLRKKINDSNYFLDLKKENINQMDNPINTKLFFETRDNSDNEIYLSKDETKIILNKKIFKRNNLNDSNLFSNHSTRRSGSYSLNSSTFSTDILKNQISKIVKDISKNHKNRINLSTNNSKIIPKISTKYYLKKDKNKSIDYYAKRKKNKLLNLLNKEGSLNNFLKSMKIKTTYNFFKARKKPKNNLEMNKLLINSFGLNKKTPNEFSKQLYTLNENFHSALKKMKKEKVEIESRNFEEKRNSNSYLTLDTMNDNERELENKIMENIYKNKLSEYEFNKFKNMIRIRQQNNIIKHSKNFADRIMNINLDEYEYPNKYQTYKSSGNCISINNINRIRKMDKLMKDLEEREQFNVLELNLEQLKSFQKKSEAEGVLAINKAGKPRFIKTKFKQSTILKYKGVSGEFFGLPA